jgi:hypothetical protein
MAKRFLSGRDFEAALVLLEGRGIDKKGLCRHLACGEHQPERWTKIGAPRYVALALTAILEGRPPWTPKGTKK